VSLYINIIILFNLSRKTHPINLHVKCTHLAS